MTGVPGKIYFLSTLILGEVLHVFVMIDNNTRTTSESQQLTNQEGLVK